MAPVMRMKIWDRDKRRFEENSELLMIRANLDPRMGFDDIGMMSDGTPVVLDRCGNYGNLDPDDYRVVVSFGE